MTCLEEISGSGGSNSLRDRYVQQTDRRGDPSSCSYDFRIRNLDRLYFKRWLLRESPQDKMDIKLLQTFKKINMDAAMKIHNTSKGLVPAASTAAMHTSASGSNLRPESTYANLAQFVGAGFVSRSLFLAVQ